MLLSLCDCQAERIFLVKDALDPVNDPDLNVELYEEMLEFEKQLHELDNSIQGKFDERLII